ncbi:MULTISPECIES: thioesterase domain-containing protein [unclassified Streptomyces]|uniref:thioesterase domain-containing protein n=1 Tax=unclassified Streptomyces TaxID=2593676 RepID=UPI0020340097|nr:thioesterase domain-containing protein [Streptomyces sp. RKAG290]MCM2411716.1 thioesterase domain-containing protein [Streptomyces sp. RKAG290]
MPQRPDPSAGRPVLTPLTSPGTGTARRLYAVHPGALAPAAWQPFAGQLPPDTALSLLDLSNIPSFFTAAFDPRTEPATVGELAGRCLAEITASKPDDAPFSLVGWSFGGVVAFAIAALLDAEGRGGTLEELVLLDSIAPVPAFKRTDEVLEPRMLLDWFAMYLGAKRDRPFSVSLPPVAAAEDGLPAVLAAATAQGLLPPDTELAGLRKLYTAYHGGLTRNNRCTAPYEPAPLDREITLVKPERSLLPHSGDLGWSQLSDRPVRQLAVAGDHYTMLQDPRTAAVLSGRPADPAVA